MASLRHSFQGVAKELLSKGASLIYPSLVQGQTLSDQVAQIQGHRTTHA
jgi:hypothetical protein